MSQKGSSVMSSDNPELKYKKALMEIQKIHNANKLLKDQSEEMKKNMEAQIADLSDHCQQYKKEYESTKKHKEEVQKYLEELQDSNTELMKEYNNLQREVGYLNDVLTEQNIELKKVNAITDQKGIANLIKTYEEKEGVFKRDIQRQDEVIAKLKSTVESLQNEIQEERRQRHKAEDQLNNSKAEISRYRELNNALISRNEAIINSLLSRSGQNSEKHRQAEQIISEFTKQLQNLKITKLQQYSQHKNMVSSENYETLLQEKNKITIQLNKTKVLLQEAQNKIKETYEVEQNLKAAQFKADKFAEECNMLKSKLIVLQTKEMMDASMVEDLQLKQFQEKVLINIMQNDPLPAIKNSGDTSHFAIMKSFISELKEKLAKTNTAKRQYERKYRSIKEKFSEKSQKIIIFEDQNKILKGKLEGYERLTERLQYELQRSMELHEEEMNKMKTLANNIVNKRSQESKVTNAFIKSQLQMEMEKAEKTEKGLKQEIQTLKLEIGTERIKSKDLEERFHQTNEFLNIYKHKFNQLSSEFAQVQQQNSSNSQNLLRYEQLYKEQRAKNESFISQKQTLNSKINQLSDQLQKKRYQSQEQLKSHSANFDNELRRLKSQLTRAKQELQNATQQIKTLKKDLDQSKQRDSNDLNNLKNQKSYYTNLQKNYNIEKDRSKQLESQLDSVKLRFEKISQNAQKVNGLEESLIVKNDQINDLKRKLLQTEKQIGVLSIQFQQAKNQLEISKKETSTLRIKLLETGQQIKREYDVKDVEGKKSLQRLNQEIVTLSSELREEKKGNLRIQNELINSKSQISRLQEFIDQLKHRENTRNDELNQMRNAYDTVSDELQRLKSQVKYKSTEHQNLNFQLNSLQDKIFKLNQQYSEMRIKAQAAQDQKNEINRQLSGLKIYLPQVEEYVTKLRASNAGGWQEQRERDNLNNLIQKIRRIVKANDITNANEYKSINSYGVKTDFNAGQDGDHSAYFSKYANYTTSNYNSNYNAGQQINTPTSYSPYTEQIKNRFSQNI